MNYRDFLQKVIYVIINPIIKMMIKLHITPNIVTFVGFIGNIVAAAFFIDAAWKLGVLTLTPDVTLDIKIGRAHV